MTDERKKFMLEASRNQATELEGFIKALKLPKETEDFIFEMPLRKVQNESGSLRGSFFKMLFHYLEQQAQMEGIELRYPDRPMLFTVQIPLLSELIISVQYLENQVYDGKGGLLREGTLDHKKVSANVQASHLLKDYVYDYIEVIAKGDPLLLDALRQTTSLIFKSVALGQRWEDTYARFDYLYSGFTEYPLAPPDIEAPIDEALVADLWTRFQQWGLPDWQAPYCRFYLRRISLTNATLFRQTALLLFELTGYEGKEKEKMMKFCTGFALMAQLVNDMGDCVPASRGVGTIHKNPEDAFADLRKGAPTLPTLLLGSVRPKEYFDLMQKRIETAEIQEAVLEDLKPLMYSKRIKKLSETRPLRTGESDRDTLVKKGLVLDVQAYAKDLKRHSLSDNKHLFADVISCAFNTKYLKHFE
jgi:hypothetical protein